MAFRGSLFWMRRCSASMYGEKCCGGRGGRDGCASVLLDGESSASMRAWAAARSAAVGSLSMYGRDSWTAVVSAIAFDSELVV